jgi:hypothetical protein
MSTATVEPPKMSLEFAEQVQRVCRKHNVFVDTDSLMQHALPENLAAQIRDAADCPKCNDSVVAIAEWVHETIVRPAYRHRLW